MPLTLTILVIGQEQKVDALPIRAPEVQTTRHRTASSKVAARFR
jgi:hypothetical protein